MRPLALLLLLCPLAAGPVLASPPPAAWTFDAPAPAAWVFDGPQSADVYTDRLRDRAIEEGVPAVIFVGAGGRPVGRYLTCRADTFGDVADGVVVAVPCGGKLYWARTLPPGATDEEIRQAVRSFVCPSPRAGAAVLPAPTYPAPVGPALPGPAFYPYLPPPPGAMGAIPWGARGGGFSSFRGGACPPGG